MTMNHRMNHRWFVGLVMSAVLTAVFLHFVPTAFADGCEGGDAAKGHKFVTFCCKNTGGSGAGDQER
jgi:hypothetical protein